MNYKRVKCPICNYMSRSRTFELYKEKHVCFCSHCKVGWILERARRDTLDSVGEKGGYFWEAFQSEETKNRLKRSLDIIKQFLEINAHTSICDVGCGFGYFLYLARTEGVHHLQGLELNPAYVPPARKYYDIDICIEKPSMLGKRMKFDIVTSFEVIEQTLDPDAFISDLKSLLKKGGSIALSTPCIDNWHGFLSRILLHISNRIGRPFLQTQGFNRWHIQVFSKKSLNYLFTKNGFKIIKHISMTDFSKPLTMYNYPFIRIGSFFHPFAVTLARIIKKIGLLPKNKQFIIARLD